MKYISLWLSCVTFSCFGMDQIKSFDLPTEINPHTIAFPSSEIIALGGKKECGLFSLSTGNYETIYPYETFTLCAHQENNSLLVTTIQGLSIYHTIKKKNLWEKNTLNTKNMCAQFISKNSVIALDVPNNMIYLFYWKENRENVYTFDQHPFEKPNWVKTPLISVAEDKKSILPIAYIAKRFKDTNEGCAAVAHISETDLKISILPSNTSGYYTQEALLSSDGKYVAVVDWTKGCIIWNQENNSNYVIDRKDLPSVIVSMVFKPKSPCLALLDSNGSRISFYQISDSSYQLIKVIKIEDTYPQLYSKRLAFSPQYTEIAVLGNERLTILPVPQDALNLDTSK